MKVVEEKDFNEEIKKGVCLVDFYASWCGPCRIMANIIEDIAEELGDKVNVFKVDVDSAETISRNYGIMSIPTLIIFKNGEFQEKHVGIWQQDDCVNAVKKYLD